MYGERLARWQRVTEWPLIASAALFLAAYSVQIIGPRAHGLQLTAAIVIWVTWATFLVDYLVSFALAERRPRWFIRHLIDLAIVVLPVLRPLRLMRFITILAIIQKHAGAIVRGRIIAYAIGGTLLIVYVASLAEFDAERHAAGANITSFGDAIWWSFTTVTTVGYGDFYPVTVLGRIVAVGLMAAGLALIGVVTATLATWLIDAVAGKEEAAEVATAKQVAELVEQIAALRAEVTAGGGEPPATSADPAG